MDFEADDIQQAIARLAGEVLDGTEPEWLWKELGRTGLLSLGVPARLGGDGLGMAEIAVLLTEVGRRAASVPALATLALGVLPVARWGTLQQQEELLTGTAVLTAAVREPSRPMPAKPATIATGDLRLTGTKVGVPYAEQALRILVPVSLGERTAVALVDPVAPGVRLRPAVSSAGAGEYTMRMDGARATGLLDGGAEAVEDLYRFGVAGACAIGDGLVAGALAHTTAHAGSRHQFGRPLAAFQAVALQLADVYVTARTIHLATLSACWRMDRFGDPDADLAVAAYWLASQGPPALRTCHHLHGGVGLDVTYPLHRYSSALKDLVRFLGGQRYRLDRLGEYACSSS
jgi:alkylation response protein AidB-like acyl-CoA dehydrogenase